MYQKLILLFLTASAFLVLNAGAETCGPDGNPVKIGEGNHCCCSEDTTTQSENDYKCLSKESKCSGEELELTFRHKETKEKLCPCKNITIN